MQPATVKQHLAAIRMFCSFLVMGQLHEKGGKQHRIPAHHTLVEYIDAYVAALAHEEGRAR